MNHKYEVLIIGGGVVGCAIARELSKYRVSAALLEKEMDVGMGASCRNSGVLHAGFVCARITQSAGGGQRERFDGRSLPRPEGEDKTDRKLTVGLDEEDEPTLRHLKEQGDTNGVPGLRVIGRERCRRYSRELKAIALHSPSSSIILHIRLRSGWPKMRWPMA